MLFLWFKVSGISNCICSRSNKSLICLIVDINDINNPFIINNTQIFPLIKFFKDLFDLCNIILSINSQTLNTRNINFNSQSHHKVGRAITLQNSEQTNKKCKCHPAYLILIQFKL